MKFFIIVIFFSLVVFTSYAQKPPDGTYTYSIAFDEWDGKSLGATCLVIIKGDSVKILDDGSGSLSGLKKGDIIEQGIIMKHNKTGQWIIGHNSRDKDAKDIGGCSGGPAVIDFKHKSYHTC